MDFFMTSPAGLLTALSVLALGTALVWWVMNRLSSLKR